MVSPQLLRFVVRNIGYTRTDAGVLVTCYSNHPCHLYLRWTNITPQKHIHAREDRGALVNSYIDQCFVAYHDIEQNEAGDTFTHTFTVEPWPGCETRWFYFWGYVSGVLSPSASCIFEYHCPYKTKFYSDPLTGGTTFDGFAYRHNVLETWAQIHDGLGRGAEADTHSLQVLLNATATPGKWERIDRAIMGFDLTAIPTAAILTSASFNTRLYTKGNYYLPNTTFGIYAATPLDYSTIHAADYQNCGDVLLSDTIPYDSIGSANWIKFTFTAAGLAYLKPPRILAISCREATYDGPDVQPPWWWNAWLLMLFHSVDSLQTDKWPYLEVNYTVPK